MRAWWLRLVVGMLVVASLVGTGVSAAERKDGRPRGSEAGPRKAERSSYPKDRGREDVDGKPGPRVALDPADQVIADDLIVQGGECVGIDCINGEDFTFITEKLKENNVRLRFDDTSASVGFSANDWELTANDSTSGGASRFSIADITGGTVPFTVEAGAATDTLVVADNDKIGVGTRAPVLDVHVETSNTPGLRLEQTAAGGFTAQTWDVAGNEANFFVRDTTSGSRLPFRIRPGAPTSAIDIAASGNVGMGTAAPEKALHISGAEPRQIRLQRTGTTSPNTWDIGDAGNGTFKIDQVGVTGVQLRVTGQGMIRLNPVGSPPTTNVALGAMYNDRSGALCWYSGSRWLKVVGGGSCR